MSTLSIFDAACEKPEATALIDGEAQLTFAEVAERAKPLATALLLNRPAVLALTPRADTESLLWLYAAWATSTPVLTLHARATAAEKQQLSALAGATEPPLPASADFAALERPAPQSSDPLVLIPTSGSTGAPRLVELSRAALHASAQASAHNLGWQPNDLWLACLPLAHAGGLSVVTRCLLARKPVLLFEPGDAGAQAKVEQLLGLARRATLVSLVPSLLQALLDAGLTGDSALRAVLLGGAACSPALAQRAHAARLPLLTSYGLTETASQVVTRRYSERFEPLPEQAGYVSSGHPLPGVELELRERGTIALRGPSLLSRYVGGVSPRDAQGWLVTSDRGQLGTGGELYVRGRSDDVIVTAGENVDPLEVEAALLELPGIEQACVFGTPSTRFGQVVSAVVVARDARLGDANNLAELLADRLSRHKLPRRVLCVDSLPLTASCKLDRRACALRYAAFLNDPTG